MQTEGSNLEGDSFKIPRLIPLYLTHADRVWIEELIDIYMMKIGRSARDLKAAISQTDFYIKSIQKFKFVELILQEVFFREDSGVSKLAQKLRAELFIPDLNATEIEGCVRKFRIKSVSKKLGISTESVEHLMFADIKSARLLRLPKEVIDPDEIRLKANLLLVQSLLLNSEKVVIAMRGMSRPLIQCAKWLGLITCISIKENSDTISMEISGPLSVLVSTKMYGHALGRLIPFLALVERFRLTAFVRHDQERKIMLIQQGDPIFPRKSLKKFDSQLECKFYDAFLKATDDWTLTRESEPLAAGSGFVFPDFVIRHVVRMDIKWYLEIVGFWTDEYLEDKIKKYSLISESRLILCINEKFAVDLQRLPSIVKVVWYKTTLKPGAVLDVLNGQHLNTSNH